MRHIKRSFMFLFLAFSFILIRKPEWAGAADFRLSFSKIELFPGNDQKKTISLSGSAEAEYWGSTNWKIVGLASRKGRSATLVPYKPGRVIIFAKLRGGGCLSCVVTVKAVPLTREKAINVVVGGYETIHLPGNTYRLTWTATDPEICSMNCRYLTSARVYGRRPGVSYVKINYKHGPSISTCKVTVHPSPKLDRVSASVNTNASYSIKINSAVMPKWSVSDPSVRIISSGAGYCNVKGTKPGTFYVIADVQHKKLRFKLVVRKIPFIAVVDTDHINSDTLIATINACGGKAELVTSSGFDIKKYDGLAIPGGGDIYGSWFEEPLDPHAEDLNYTKDRIQLESIRKFVAAKKPVFGVCRGMQLINIALGGSLYQHITGHRCMGEKLTYVTDSGIMKNLYGDSLYTWHHHHQAIKRLASGLRVTMRDADGTIEAVEHSSLPVFGVQWHPELTGEKGRKLIRKFVQMCQ